MTLLAQNFVPYFFTSYCKPFAKGVTIPCVFAKSKKALGFKKKEKKKKGYSHRGRHTSCKSITDLSPCSSFTSVKSHSSFVT